MTDYITQINIGKLRDTIQECNINFLLGAGMSAPYLSPLGSIEVLLTELEKQEISNDEKKIIRASLYKNFFDEVILKNLNILNEETESKEILQNYVSFLKEINNLLLKRKSTILSKQVNIFTSNIDIFLEKSLEISGLEYNDGFHGRFNPKFNLNNLKKSHFKKSLHYDNTSEIPVFNLLKIHGSLTWETSQEENAIKFSNDLSLINEVKKIEIKEESLIKIPDGTTIAELVKESRGKTANEEIASFMQVYEKLPIINPTKEKFKQTLLNKTYYDQLRIYANELEKANTVLFVMGFSFADEHIRDMTIRAANSNPTLIIYVFARSSKSSFDINFDEVKNNNICIISPPHQSEENPDKYEYNLETINSHIFQKLLQPNQDKAHTALPTNDPNL